MNEETIKRLFVTAINKLLVNRDEILANFDNMKQVLFDTSDLQTEHTALQSEMSVLAGMIQQCVDENTRVAQNQDEYRQRYEGLVGRFEAAKHRFEDIGSQLSDIKGRSDKMDAFIDSLRKQSGLISEFDEQLWYSLVDYITVYSKDDVRVMFKDGTVIQA